MSTATLDTLHTLDVFDSTGPALVSELPGRTVPAAPGWFARRLSEARGNRGVRRLERELAGVDPRMRQEALAAIAHNRG